MEFREQLMRLRKSRGWSQEELGARVGVTRQTVSKWELGDTTPELEKLIALAELFDMTTDQLLGRQAQAESRTEERRRLDYEYVSSRRVRGIPLVHIHVGPGFCRARGVVAIGNVATGILSIGGFSLGVLSLGGFGLGLLAMGGWAVGLLAALGGLALGFLAVGGIAVGVFAVGGLAVGVYALGGWAAAARVAAGGYARGTIAIGDVAVGEVTFSKWSETTGEAIRQAVLQRFPHTWEPLVWLFSRVCGS